MKIIKKIAKLLLLLFIALQFFRPDKNSNQGDHTVYFRTETNPPEDVMAILTQSCFDCHSSNTQYPWYNNIAPVSYWISNHIKHGKEELNFSEWDQYSKNQKDHKLEELIEEVEAAKMPLNEYTWTHEKARLTEEQQKAVVEWAKRTRILYGLGELPR